MKPVWLLDVDGVINALMPHRSHHQAWVADHLGREFLIRFDPRIITQIIQLTEIVDIHWCTTWGEDAVSYLSPALGLPTFPVEDPKRDYESLVAGLGWWKYWRFLESRSYLFPTVWTDDDIPDDLMHHHRSDPDSLIIRTNPYNGLSLENLQQIESWVQSLESLAPKKS